jgi:hypothetical protein
MGTARQKPPSPELKTFASRLNKAIALKKIDLAVIAKKLNCAPADVKKMTIGMREPSMKRLIALANAIECSVDYLLGLTPEANCASVAVTADTNAVKPNPVERAPTPGRVSDKVDLFIGMLPELLEADVDLLAYLAGFLISRKRNNLANLAKAVIGASAKERRVVKSPTVEVSLSKPKDEVDFDDEDLFNDADNFEDEEFDDDFEDDFLDDEFEN